MHIKSTPVPPATRTTTGSVVAFDTLRGSENPHSGKARLTLNVSAASRTTPTFNVVVGAVLPFSATVQLS